MSIQKAYNDWSATYDTDRNLTRDLDQRVTRDALADGHFRAILELGCGTGKNTPLLAQLGERVLALDFSSGMIARAQAKVRAANVRFATADITIAWPCASRAMDLIVCSLILEHIADLGFIFAEAARVLVDGGQLLICELHPFRQYEGKKAVFQREGGQTEIPAFVHHISDFLTAAAKSGLTLAALGEWWHDEDQGKPPRLVSFRFTKRRQRRWECGQRPTAQEEDIIIRYAVAPCTLGWVLVAATAQGICRIDLGDAAEELRARLDRTFPQAELVADDPAFGETVAGVVALLEHPRRGLALPLDIQGTAFQRQVWLALQGIPAGSTASYAEIAARIGRPRAARAVAQACAANKLAVAIPCHRVVRHNGDLSGYRWGVERKRALLAREAESPA